jgi:hypothetical protein
MSKALRSGTMLTNMPLDAQASRLKEGTLSSIYLHPPTLQNYPTIDVAGQFY